MENDTITLAEEPYVAIQGEGTFVGIPMLFVRTQGCNVGCEWCLVPSTHVYTTQGTKEAKDVVVGDELIGKDKDGKIAIQQVQEVMFRQVSGNEILCIDIGECDKLYVTKEHPVYSLDKGIYIQAQELTVGELIDRLPINTYQSWRMRNNNPMKNKEVSTRVGKQLSIILSGREQSVEWRQKNSDWHKKYNPMKDPVVALKNANSHKRRPSGIEQIVIAEFIDHKLPVTYVGDNKLWVGDQISRYKNPDFVVDGQKKVIELFCYGSYGRDEMWAESRKKHFEKFGWECLMLDVTHKIYSSKRDNIIARVSKFITNGKRVVGLSVVSPKQLVRLGAKKVCGVNNHWRDGICSQHTSLCYEITVHNFRTNPDHTYYAEGILTHNCDSYYTWSPYNESRVPTAIHSTVKPLVVTYQELMQKIVDSKANHIWFTGGEPTLQAKEIAGFLKEIMATNYRTYHICTAGWIWNEFLMSVINSIVIDVKPPSSLTSSKENFIERCIGDPAFRQKTQLKIVVANTPDDREFAKTIVERYSKFVPITLQPLYVSEVELLKIVPDKRRADYCSWHMSHYADWFTKTFNKYNNVRLGLQLHKVLYPDKFRGI